MTALKVKDCIRQMSKYDIDKLSQLAQKSGISLMVINFWWNALKN
jgi:hypothetical protein